MKADIEAATQVLSLDIGSAPNVLLIDDDELALARLESILTASGFAVRTATSGLAALSFLKEMFSPVVITDFKMPCMDGLSVCRAIRQESWPGYIYILLLTIQDAEADVLAGLDAGADDYLSKRMSSAQVLARLRTARRILTLEHSLKSALAEKRRLALTDELTGAPNRRYFRTRLSRELERVLRFGGNLSLLSLDIDNFKIVNDRYGHAAGDSVLQEVVKRISRCLPRNTDWCARLGGEEFSVVLEQTDLAGARIVAERLRHTIAESPVITRAGAVQVTVSIGVSGLEALEHRKRITLDALLNHADAYLYASKERGRDCVTSADSLTAA
jgi:two-component system, cell cycle response regulator